MSNINTQPIKIQIRDIYHKPIQNANIKILERKTNKILYNQESANGEVILDDIQSLKNTHAFKVQIDHPHYKSTPKTNAPCIREVCKGRFHTLEFPYQDKLLVSSVYANYIESNSNDKHIYNQQNNIYGEISPNSKSINIALKAYYNQDSIPNKDKHTDIRKHLYQQQKKETKWGYIVFDKHIDIDSKLKELTKDSSIPIVNLTEFRRIYKSDDIESNKPNPYSTNSYIKSSNYILGEEIHIRFKQEWRDKQVRFFAYIEGAKSDVSVDVEVKTTDYTIEMYVVDGNNKDDLPWYENENIWVWIDGATLLIPVYGWGIKAATTSGRYVAKGIHYIGTRLTKRASTIKNNKNLLKRLEFSLERVIIRSKNKTMREKYTQKPLQTLPQNVKDRYRERVKNRWDIRNRKTHKFESGKDWHNDFMQLPTHDKQGNLIRYKEHDVNVVGRRQSRDKERIVTGYDDRGNLLLDYIYYTNDHYVTFAQIILK
ncbi:ribonuclease domain-containing protein [Helicobacter sp. T3_23-1059]